MRKFTVTRKLFSFICFYIFIIYLMGSRISEAYISIILTISIIYLWNYSIIIDDNVIIVKRLILRNVKVPLDEVELIKLESNHLGYGSWAIMDIKSHSNHYEFKITHFNQKELMREIDNLSGEYQFELDKINFRVSKFDIF